MLHIIKPNVFIETTDPRGPVFYLLGPTAGGGAWQNRACHLLLERLDECTVATSVHPSESSLPNSLRVWQGIETLFKHEDDWARHWQERAAQHGCIICWLAAENVTDPRTDGLPYGIGSNNAMAEWRGRGSCDNRYRTIRMAVGGEPDFPYYEIVTRGHRTVFGAGQPIFSTLEETVDQAVKVALHGPL